MVTGTLLLYLIVGLVVAASVPPGRQRALARCLLGLGHVLFWPFFAPGLLGRGAGAAEPDPSVHPELGPRLYRAKARLVDAIATSTQLSHGMLAPQLELIDAVMASLQTASNRLSEMDAVLHTPEFDAGRIGALLGELRARGLAEGEPRVASLLSRQENIGRLLRMRQKTQDELECALFALEAISARVLLLDFTDPPESKLERLLAEVTHSINDLSSLVLELSEL
jgi:hypothetical protein